MSEIELIPQKPFNELQQDLIKSNYSFKDMKYDLIYTRIANLKYLDCNFDIFECIASCLANVTFENCVIENLLIKHESVFKNVKFVNCKIKNINMTYNRIDLESFIEFLKLESVFKIYWTQIRISSNNYLTDIYNMDSDILTSELYNSFDDIRIHIGCKMKSITQWNHWFEKSTEEYNTPRNTEKFERIKNEYYKFRDKTIEKINNYKKNFI